MESNTDFAPQESLVADITNSLATTIVNAVRDEFKRPEFAGNPWVNEPGGYDDWADVIAEEIARDMVRDSRITDEVR